MSDPVLSLRGVDRTYVTEADQLEVLKSVDFDLYAGELVGLVGPSGSGKSSLLHAAALLETPNAGQVFINGVDGLSLGENQRTKLRRETIGFVYQFHHLLPELTALENVSLPRIISGVAKSQADADAINWLGQLGLSDRLNHRPGQLSGGEQQRVAIARALVNSPQILLADEPTGNLDPATSDEVFNALSTACRSTGTAALVATHNLDLAQRMNRVVTLKDGHINSL